MSVREEVCAFHSLYQATAKAKRNVCWKDSVARFFNHSLKNVYYLKQSLDNNTYQISPYSQFEIFEPKHRQVCSTRFKDRVFQKSLCDRYLYREITRVFIPNNFACQIGKGTDRARKCLEKMMIGKIGWYALKIDIHDYFGSTNHEKLSKCLKDIIRDKWAYEEVNRIIYSFDKGIGLGSQVSQLMQLAFLNKLDHLITDKWHIKHYVRYMDDLIIIHNDKSYLHRLLRKIHFILTDYDLQLNCRKTQIIKLTNPIHFLGFSFLINKKGKVTKKILPCNIKRRRRKLKRQVNKMQIIDIEVSYQCWRAFAKKSDSRGAILKMDKYKESLIMNKELIMLEQKLGLERAETEFAKDKDERYKKINEEVCKEFSLSTQIAILRKALKYMGCDEPEFLAFFDRVEEIKASIGND